MRQRPPAGRQLTPKPVPSPSLPGYLSLPSATSHPPSPGNIVVVFPTETSPSAALLANTSIMVTPAKSERDEEVMFRGDDKEEVDTFRVVDFAVVYLSRGTNGERILKQLFTLHEFVHYYAPILAEGKRPPHQNNLDARMMRRLRTLIELAEKDIFMKRLNFFEKYRCKSIIGIAFSGPYWTFCICRHDENELSWSKAISPESSLHATILDTIFEAAESDPVNPGGHPRLQDLFALHRRDTEESLQLVIGNHLDCYPPS
ncbi:hypothetical protein ACGC1H_003486 [Rhizoctonia solani]